MSCKSINEPKTALKMYFLLILMINAMAEETPSCRSSALPSLKHRLKLIESKCGQICNTSNTGASVDSWPYKRISKELRCHDIFDSLMDEKSEFGFPPRRIPKALLPLFLYDDKLELRNAYRDDAEQNAVKWPRWMVEKIFEMLRNDQLRGAYGKQVVDDMQKVLKQVMNIDNKRVLVIGSTSPWIEAILVELGAKEVVTLDYIQIEIEDWPQVEAMMPHQLIDKFKNNLIQPFDAIVSFSSLEHSGLGRYGDALNPWGDLITMARAHCLLRPGGQALIGVPVGPTDILAFNSHRLYGPLMLAHLFANFEFVYTDLDIRKFDERCDYCYQPIFVVEKPSV